MSKCLSNGGVGEDEHLSLQYGKTTPIDTSHYLSSSSMPSFVPITTKTVDIQTDSTSGLSGLHNATSTQTSTISLPAPSTSTHTQQLSVRQHQQLAKYIESEMKEKYMEQTRTLEQFQVLMRQDLLDKQAQLMQQIQRGLDIPPDLSNGRSGSTSSSSSPKSVACANGSALRKDRSSTNGITTGTPRLHQSGPTISTMSTTAVPDSSPLNSYTLLHNGNNLNGRKEDSEVVGNVLTSSSFSADESVNGNTSQGSSHDTWDSANAFAHERPVLTGSERSTPTPVLPSVDSNNDLELISQSIHLPVDVLHRLSDRSSKVSQTDLKSNGNKSSEDLIDLSSHLSEPVTDENTPRNMAAENDSITAGETMTSAPPLCNGNKELDTSLVVDDELQYSGSSTPPPESPADELSASLRYSLREKHSRHLADMKAYYEQELSDLKDKLTSSLTSSLTISQHQTYQSMESQNEKLRERCRILEDELIRANRYINTVDKQMEELECSFNATMVASSRTGPQSAESEDLRNMHEDQVYKNKFTQAESYIKSLETKNKDLLTALCDAYEVRDNTSRTASQTNLLYDEMKPKYEELKVNNERTMMKLQSSEDSLKNCHDEMVHLKAAIRRLEVEHHKLAKENEVLRLTLATPLRNSSYSKLQSSADEPSISPVLKAERQLEKTSTSSPNKHKSRHHHPRSDRNRHHSNRHQSPDLRPATDDKPSPPHSSDLNNHLSPQPLSDATQSSDNSSKDYPKTQSRSHTKRSDHRLMSEQSTPAQAFYQDDLVSAYSPIVDRQRHSSSASSSGPVLKSAASPSRQSIDRPYGFHHVGASVSPSKRTQQWAIGSPFNRTTELTRKDRENNNQSVSPQSARKNLSFSLNKPAITSPQKTKIDRDEVLGKVRSGRVLSGERDRSLSPTISDKKKSGSQSDRMKLIKDAETRLDELLIEKRQLESSLTRVSTTHNRKDKQRQEDIEQQLDKVDKDLGSVRMTLRRYNVL